MSYKLRATSYLIILSVGFEQGGAGGVVQGQAGFDTGQAQDVGGFISAGQVDMGDALGL